LEDSFPHPPVRRSKVGTVAILGILTITATLSAVVPAAAASGVQVFVSYADSLRADPTNFPTPWSGSPGTVFYGCEPAADCVWDGAAVRVVNNSNSTITVNSIAVHVDTCTYTGWPSATLTPGMNLIVTQLASGAFDGCSGPTPTHFDLSDVGPGGSDYSNNCEPDHILPTVDVTINGTTTSYTDGDSQHPGVGQVLNTGGIDAGPCVGNESIQWTLIGSGPCRGSALTLAPPTQTHPVLSTATVTGTFTNGCGQPLSNTAVAFAISSGPNAGVTGSGVTDGNGHATFTYSSTKVGTDTLQASVTNLAGNIPSNTVTATWTISFAPGGGAFVISDRANVMNANVYWWGAQWWKMDRLNAGFAPASFKGYENSNSSPWCNQSWTTRPGNSPHPPKSVPSLMAVIVSSHITKSGSTISGNIAHIVLVRTNPGYSPNPGHRGTGTIVDVIC
jgi:hypothetical protein